MIKVKVMIAGGGTAGHINPGLAIAKTIRQHQKADILFVGTEKGLESKLVPREGFELKVIKVRGFKRKLSLDTLAAVKELLQGILQARKLIKSFKPDIVIGTGGYVCGPVVYSAAKKGIPTLIHEQNAFPGVTNKILSRYVDTVAVSFNESESYFKAAKHIVHTGNPVRDEIVRANRDAALKKLGIREGRPRVVIMGGSRGAGRINDTAVELLLKYHKGDQFDILLATGEQQYDNVKQQLQGYSDPSAEVVPYIYNAADVYAAADLVVCRAGAITVSELQVLGVPAILIPSPNVTANHQEYNARVLEKAGGAVVILEKDLSAKLLHEQLQVLLQNREQLNAMGKNAKKSAIANAGEKIYEIVQELTERKKG